MCGGELIFLDLDTNAPTIKHGIEVDTISNTMLTFSTERLLNRNHHYNVTVNASNNAGSVLSPPFTISKEFLFVSL